ncbi:hypothetical protein E2C01_085428 [Portunus trituberculatus]|uniref:Uncharacterized protein n=1 Tax=Portunus trituberculatus TaxID=210409 RepID=A0A5B7J0Y7_PORTR|nr:hypothetical protein [Portunus trituberculatus]
MKCEKGRRKRRRRRKMGDEEKEEVKEEVEEEVVVMVKVQELWRMFVSTPPSYTLIPFPYLTSHLHPPPPFPIYTSPLLYSCHAPSPPSGLALSRSGSQQGGKGQGTAGDSRGRQGTAGAAVPPKEAITQRRYTLPLPK